MSRRLQLFALVAVVPTVVDGGILVVLRQGAELPLIVADAVAIAVASVLSYGLHRRMSFRSDPYFRWVRHPGAFAVIATAAGLVDVVMLRLVFAAHGFTTVGPLLGAKAVALAAAAVVRGFGYRYVLADEVREARDPVLRPLPESAFRLSVILPAFRESGTIGAAVAAVRAELDDVHGVGGVEIVVVDDGSGDATADEALAAGADQVIVQPVNRGKGAAVRAGVEASRGAVVVFTDADLAYSPDHLRTVCEQVEAGADVVIGDRGHPDSEVSRASGLRAIGSRVVNLLSAAVLLARPRDTQCGLKGFRGDVARDLFRLCRVDGFAFDIEVLHLVERAGLSLVEIPVRLAEPVGSPSTVRVGRDIGRLVVDLARIRHRSSSGAYDELGSEVPAPTSQSQD